MASWNVSLPVGLLCPGDSLGKNTRVGYALFQDIFPTQGSYWHLLRSPALTSGFFTTSTTCEAQGHTGGWLTLVFTKAGPWGSSIYKTWDLVRDALRTSQVVQWLRLCASTAGVTGSIPGQGNKIPPCHSTKKKKKKKTRKYILWGSNSGFMPARFLAHSQVDPLGYGDHLGVGWKGYN